MATESVAVPDVLVYKLASQLTFEPHMLTHAPLGGLVESLEQSIRRHLVDYLAGKESYDDFVDWMYGVIVNIDQRGERDASSLGYTIMLAIAEYDNDDLSLNAFKDTLRDLAQPAAIRTK